MAVDMSIPPVAVAVGANVFVPESVGGYNNSKVWWSAFTLWLNYAGIDSFE